MTVAAMYQTVAPSYEALGLAYERLSKTDSCIGILHGSKDNIRLHVQGCEHKLSMQRDKPQQGIAGVLGNFPAIDVLLLPEIGALAAAAYWRYVDIGELDRIAAQAGVKLIVSMGPCAGSC